MSYNLYATANANLPQSPTDLHSDPHVVDLANGNLLRLASSPPAINKGALLQLGGFPARDLAGGTRVVGSRIDLGAYESSIDDSTTAIVTTTSDNGNNSSPTPGSLRAAIKAANAAAGRPVHDPLQRRGQLPAAAFARRTDARRDR
ncbi:MAG TPA: choice-of-anchor Q domain-containing protein [Dokdonella sp.]|nr:choice-of-anchor Q domain-containing protein [Dokdonella sp.]